MRQKPAAMVQQQKESAKSKARSKLIAETKKGLKHVVKKYGKPSEHKMPKKVGFVHEGTQFEFAIRKVKKKDGTKSKRWVRVVYKSPKPCGQGKKRSEETNRCVNIEPKKRTYKPCGAGRKRSDKTNRCVNIERKSPKGPQTARGKKAAETRLLAKALELQHGKASEYDVGDKAIAELGGKEYVFVVHNVKNKKTNAKKKTWVRHMERKKTTKSSGGLQKVQPSKIDPVFSGLGDLPGAPAGLRM